MAQAFQSVLRSAKKHGRKSLVNYLLALVVGMSVCLATALILKGVTLIIQQLKQG